MDTSGYSQITTMFVNWSTPVFFSEYGCTNPSPRKFMEVLAIYGLEMSRVFSGGIVYRYFQEEYYGEHNTLQVGR